MAKESLISTMENTVRKCAQICASIANSNHVVAEGGNQYHDSHHSFSDDDVRGFSGEGESSYDGDDDDEYVPATPRPSLNDEYDEREDDAGKMITSDFIIINRYH